MDGKAVMILKVNNRARLAGVDSKSILSRSSIALLETSPSAGFLSAGTRSESKSLYRASSPTAFLRLSGCKDVSEAPELVVFESLSSPSSSPIMPETLSVS